MSKESKNNAFEWLDTKDDHKRWGICVKPSKLLNNVEMGLYAIKDFMANEKIAPYLGEELSVLQRQHRYGKSWGPYIYFKPWGHPSIDAQFYRGAAAFANDGSWIPLNDNDYMPRIPNLSNARLERGFLVADKPIKKGEEILLNYGENYWKRRYIGDCSRGSWQPQLLFPESMDLKKKNVATLQKGGAQTSAQTRAQTSAQTSAQTRAQTSAQTSAQTRAQTSAQTSTKTSAQTSGKGAARATDQNKIANINRKIEELTPVYVSELDKKGGKIYFKRDDLFEYAGNRGGKVRTCLAYILNHLEKNGIKGLVTGGSRSSPQVQIVGGLATDLGLKARLHLPKGELPAYIKEACKNHIVKQWFPGYNHVISARVHEDTNSLNEINNQWLEIPFGMEVQQAIDLTAEQVKNLPFDNIDRIVIPVGSGMTLAGIIEGLKRYKPDFLGKKEILGVVVGQDPSKRLDKWTNNKDWRNYVQLVDSGLDYHDAASKTTFSGIDLDPIYEAKTIPFLRDRDLLWIIGHR
jgi:1-aminocyclopropane-1-carboxylate deaminase/D-cysteine desulfhydrase-like pyridoxal-dependent ACC family enzyme